MKRSIERIGTHFLCFARLIFPAVLLIIMSGCLNNPFLGKCDDGKIRDSFGNCMDLGSAKNHPTNPPEPSTGNLNSACICKLSGGKAEAWFTWEPEGFNAIRGRTVAVSSSRCIDITACPMLHDDDRCDLQGKDEQQCFYIGTHGLAVEQSFLMQSLINGRKSWGLIGVLDPPQSRLHIDPMQRSQEDGQSFVLEPELSPGPDTHGLALRILKGDDLARDQAFFASNIGQVVPTLGFRGQLQAGTNKSAVQKAADTVTHSDCENECANDSPFCLKVNLDDANSMASKVEKARQLMMDQTKDRIVKSQFTSIFDVKNDPCDRKDTLLSPTQVTNEGKSCYLSSDIQDGSATFTFVVSLPKELKGKRSLDGNRLKLTFEDPTKSPAVTIGDARYDHDFGGIVTWATADSSSGIIATKRGCIAVKTQSSK
jgi:hypothetical protein